MQNKIDFILVSALRLGIFLFIIALISPAEAAETSFKMVSIEKEQRACIDFNKGSFKEKDRDPFKVIVVEKKPGSFLVGEKKQPMCREYTVYRQELFGRKINIFLKIGSFSTTFKGHISNGMYRITEIDKPTGTLYANLPADNAELDKFKDDFEKDINDNLLYFTNLI